MLRLRRAGGPLQLQNARAARRVPRACRRVVPRGQKRGPRAAGLGARSRGGVGGEGRGGGRAASFTAAAAAATRRRREPQATHGLFVPDQPRHAVVSVSVSVSVELDRPRRDVCARRRRDPACGVVHRRARHRRRHGRAARAQTPPGRELERARRPVGEADHDNSRADGDRGWASVRIVRMEPDALAARDVVRGEPPVRVARDAQPRGFAVREAHARSPGLTAPHARLEARRQIERRRPPVRPRHQARAAPRGDAGDARVCLSVCLSVKMRARRGSCRRFGSVAAAQGGDGDAPAGGPPLLRAGLLRERAAPVVARPVASRCRVRGRKRARRRETTTVIRLEKTRVFLPEVRREGRLPEVGRVQHAAPARARRPRAERRPEPRVQEHAMDARLGERVPGHAGRALTGARGRRGRVVLISRNVVGRSNRRSGVFGRAVLHPTAAVAGPVDATRLRIARGWYHACLLVNPRRVLRVFAAVAVGRVRETRRVVVVFHGRKSICFRTLARVSLPAPQPRQRRREDVRQRAEGVRETHRARRPEEGAPEVEHRRRRRAGLLALCSPRAFRFL